MLFEMIYVQDVSLTKEYDVDDYPTMNPDYLSQEIIGNHYNLLIGKLYFDKNALFEDAFDKTKKYRIVINFCEVETRRNETYTLHSCTPGSFELMGKENDLLVARVSYQSPNTD